MMSKNSLKAEMIAELTGFDIQTAVTTYTGSKEFMKLMLPVTVINILHSRTDIDRKNFKHFALKDINYVSFKSKSTHKCIRDYHIWMKGAKDAIDKTYLREMMLIMKDENNHVEHYKFRFKYLRNEQNIISPNSQSADELIRAMRNMINQIKELQKYEKLTGDIHAKVEFIFSEEVTPRNYVPKNFYKINETQLKMFYEGKTEKEIGHVDVGTINTGFHSLKCTGFGTLLIKSTESEDTQLDLSANADIVSITESAVLKEKQDDLNLSCSLNDRDDDILKKTCICLTNINDPSLQVRMCTKCLSNFHTACHGYFATDEVPSEFVCNICAKKENLPQDPVYFKEYENERVILCLLRLAVVYAYRNKTTPSLIFNQCKSYQQDKLKDRLIHLSVLTKKQLSFIPRIEENMLVRKLFNNAIMKEDESHGELKNSKIEESTNTSNKRISSPSVISLISIDSEENINCICDVNISIPALPMQTCQSCNKQFHIACLHYLYEVDVPDPLICHNCLDPQELMKIDQKFSTRKSLHEKKLFSTFRLVCAYCILMKEYPQHILDHLNQESKGLILKHLSALSVIKDDGKICYADLEKYTNNLFKVDTQDSTTLPDTEDLKETNTAKKQRVN